MPNQTTPPASDTARLRDANRRLNKWNRIVKGRNGVRARAQRRLNRAKANRVARRHQRDAIQRGIQQRNQPKLGGADRGVKWALSQVSVHEVGYSNRGPQVDQWNRAAMGIVGVPWCQSFADAAVVAGGGPQIHSGYTPFVMGQYPHVTREQARPGDYVYFKWPGVSHDPCDHIGVLVSKPVGEVQCVEGNTSPGSGGSQNNGGGVYLRTRSVGYVVAYVRPPYGR